MLIIRRPATDPYFNLATEEYVLKHFEEDSFMLWRNEPSIIVGKHQNTLAEFDLEYINKNNIKVIRRLSGGGAVFHDLGNINFTFISHGEPGTLVDFKKFTKPILEVIHKLGIQAKFEGRNDLTINGKKFSGNAEHVYKNKVLHHGTMLYSSNLSDLSRALKVDPSKYTDKAVKSRRSLVTNISEHLVESMRIEDFMEMIYKYIQERHPDVKMIELSEDDHTIIRKLVEEKYSSWGWNFGYSPTYHFQKQILTSRGGQLKLNLIAESGSIVSASFSADTLGSRNIAALETSLEGLPHTLTTIQQFVSNFDIGEYFNQISEEEFVSLFF